MFELNDRVQRPELVSPLVLAYLGDAVYELAVRLHLIQQSAGQVSKLHRLAVDYVRADAQAAALQYIEPYLEPAELAMARRGRNANSGHPPRGADLLSYRRSTGLECLIGYLFLSGHQERLRQLLELIFAYLEKKEAEN
ncbi:MAG: Mini-ribonuclease 3 [Bacillota bacterium]|uniref:Mini-ribonuclease 3 n=1 Tax=Desulfurispora thermophila TaxID=265470 RepID=UPI0003806244|nr:ribonuclease III domain-containing protein [Desulfurispora thermophila]